MQIHIILFITFIIFIFKNKLAETSVHIININSIQLRYTIYYKTNNNLILYNNNITST